MKCEKIKEKGALGKVVFAIPPTTKRGLPYKSVEVLVVS